MGIVFFEKAKDAIVEFRELRDWPEHTALNCAVGLQSELGELSEHFLWYEDEELLHKLMQDTPRRAGLRDELPDVLYWICGIATHFDINLEKAIVAKSQYNAQRFSWDVKIPEGFDSLAAAMEMIAAFRRYMGFRRDHPKMIMGKMYEEVGELCAELNEYDMAERAGDSEEKDEIRDRIRLETADVLCNLLLLHDVLDLDMEELFWNKMERHAEKYSLDGPLDY